MTAAVRSTPNLSIPQTQNTAPVLEFSCLYTHDIRRKQKRWQDGFLRYHTFNKRVMVYDVPRNFLGDLHWTDSADLQEGDEMMLEKGGVLVQVAEQVGRTETDLSELLQRKDKPSPAKQFSSPNPSFAPRTAVKHQTTSTAQTYTKHKSLNSLLGPSRGLIGKSALPTTSPFQERNKTLGIQERESERSRKRQKTEVRNTTTRTIETTKPTTPALGSVNRPTTSNSARNVDTHQRQLAPTEVIDLLSDNEEKTVPGCFTDTDLLTSSPSRLPEITTTAGNIADSDRVVQKTGYPLHVSANNGVGQSPSVRQLQRRQAPVAIQTPLVKRSRRQSPIQRTVERHPDDVEQQRSPPVRTSNTASANLPEPLGSLFFTTSGESERQGKALKLGGSAPRRMLVFQGQASKDSLREKHQTVEKQTLSDEREPAGKRHKGVADKSPPIEKEPEEVPQSIHRIRLQERLAHIDRKQRSKKQTSVERGTTTVNPTACNIPQGTNSLSKPQPPAYREGSTSSIEEAGLSSVQDQRRHASKTFLHPRAQETSKPNNNRSGSISGSFSKSPSPASVPISNAAKAMPPPPPKSYNKLKSKLKDVPVYNMKASGTATTMLGKPFKTPSAERSRSATGSPTIESSSEEDLGPWSKEAFDLMDWRPPDQDAAGIKIVDSDGGGKDENGNIKHPTDQRGPVPGLSGGVDAP